MPALAVVLAAAAALGAGLCVVRVPPGHLGACGDSILATGWHLRPPLRPLRLVPLVDRLDAVRIERTTPEGARVPLRLSLTCRLDPDRVGGAAHLLASGGVEGLVATLAGSAVDHIGIEELVSGAGAPAMHDAILASLRAGGVEADGLDVRVGQGAGDETPAAGAPAREPTGVRLVLVGLDGADWKTIDPLLRAGRMPRLARLLAGGARAPLRSYDPMISPLLWTTMATGLGPDSHGVADFQAIEAASGRHVPITSRFRKVKALWNMLDDAGATSAFVAWWASYPVEEVRGFQISNLVAFETMRPRPAGRPEPAGLTWPPDYLDTVAPRLITAADIRYDDLRAIAHVGRDEFEAARREVLDPPAADPDGENRRAMQRPLALAISVLTGTRNYAAIAADLAARRPDLTAVYFEGIDMIGHRFQHCMPPRLAICSDADFARFRDAVTGFYAVQDRLLGEVLDAAGPQATVMLVSDHGFRTGGARPADVLPYTTQQPVEWHDPEGIFTLSGPAARHGVRLAARPTLFDIAPTVLHLLGLPSGADMPGRVVAEAIDPAFMAAHPPRTIPTWEHVGGPRRIAGSASDPASRAAESELLAGLRALGYIGGGSDDGGAGDGGAAPATPPATTATPPATAAVEETQVFYHRNLATYFLKRQDYSDAVEQLLLANQRHSLPKTWQMLSEAYLGLGRTDDAVAAAMRALDDEPGADPEPVLWLVQLRLRGPGGSAAARADASRYAARTAAKPGLDDAIAGVLFEAEGARDAALARYRASFAADSRRTLAAERLYALLPADRRAAELLPALRRSVAADPRQDEAQNLVGVLLAESGREEDAVAAFRQAVDLDPDNPRYAANLGGALARLGRWSASADAYERAQSLSASAANALRLGSVYRRLGDSRKALEAFTDARRRGDTSPAPYLGIALAQADLGRADEALRAVQDGLERNPGDAGLARLRDDLTRRLTGTTSGHRPARASEASVVPGG
jgi:tetratricopeptide (TPR) repeat protein